MASLFTPSENGAVLENVIRESSEISNAVEIRGLTKSFRASRSLSARTKAPVLQNLDLSLKKGEILGLMGPNGSGKTTLLKILCGLVMPDEGEISILGFKIPKERNRVKSSISFVAGEDRSFYPRLTGRQNLHFFAALQGLTQRAAEERIRELVRFLNIQDSDRWYQEHSAGMKQRLSIARGLLSNPQLILLDEPTRYLDIQERQNFLTLIRRLKDSKNEVSVIWATHDAEEIAGIADRIAILTGGSIEVCGSLAELQLKSGEKATLSETYLRHLTESVILRSPAGATKDLALDSSLRSE